MGAARTGGRWNSKGKAVVYTSRSVSLAYLETLAHSGKQVPRNLFLVCVSVPDDVWEAAIWVAERELPRAWRAEPPGISSARLGDAWLDTVNSALLCLPSVIVPEGSNVLLNPMHVDFEKITAKVERQLLYDPRLLRL